MQPVTYAAPVAEDDGGSNSGYETMQPRGGGPPPLVFENNENETESNDAGTGAARLMYTVPVEAGGGVVHVKGPQVTAAYENVRVDGTVRKTPLPPGPAMALLLPPWMCLLGPWLSRLAGVAGH